VTTAAFDNSRSVIFGCSGPVLTPQERNFFRETRPVGFILFTRNCETPSQIKQLVHDLRMSVSLNGQPDRAVPVLIDQEGGRVQRLHPPHWRDAPAASRFLDMAKKNSDLAVEAALLNAQLMAAELIELGITVNCSPVVDIPQSGAHEIISDRTWGRTPEQAARFGRIVADGLLSGGVLPVIKHIPGHGRAMVDSHHDLPTVTSAMHVLEKTDFKPFKLLNDLPWAMTAHIIYQMIDVDSPATCSEIMIKQIIRQHIGFEGVLISDDLSMKALAGDFFDRARSALTAGCDIVLHCNGDMDEMESVASGVDGLTNAAKLRLQRAEQQRLESYENDKGFNADNALLRLGQIFEQTGHTGNV